MKVARKSLSSKSVKRHASIILQKNLRDKTPKVIRSNNNSSNNSKKTKIRKVARVAKKGKAGRKETKKTTIRQSIRVR